MQIKPIAAAMAAVMIAPLAVYAADGPTVYGKMHASIDHVDFDNDAVTAGDNNKEGDYWRVVSRASRLGVKGAEELGGGLSAIYKMEFQIDIADASGSSADHIKARDQYVGLTGNWGTFLLGRHDTPFKILTGKDLFSDTVADWNDIGFHGGAKAIVEDNRADNAIMYKSPELNGFAMAALVSPGENGVDDDDINDHYTSVGGKYSNGPLYVALAHEATEYQGDDSANPTRDDQDMWRVFASYNLGDFKLGGMYQDVENDGNLKDVDSDIWQLNGTYNFGNNALKLAYQQGEVDDSRAASAAYDAPEYDAWILALEHKFSKRTSVYAIYTQTDTNDDAKVAASLGAGTEDWDAVSLGMVHSF